jgi:hypothetical protein
MKFGLSYTKLMQSKTWSLCTRNTEPFANLSGSHFLLANYFTLFILLFPFSPIETPKLCYVCSLWHLHSLHPQHFAFVPCIFGQLTLIFHLFLHFPLLFLICILLFFLIVNLHWFSSCDLHWGVNVFLLYVLIVLEMSNYYPPVTTLRAGSAYLVWVWLSEYPYKVSWSW